MLLTALSFRKDKRIADQYSILALKAVGFSQGLLPPWAQQKYQEHGEIKFHESILYTWYQEKYFYE